MTAPGSRRTAFTGALAALLFAVGCTPVGDGDFKLQGGDEMKPERILRKHRLGANVSDRRIARAAYDDAVAMRAGKAPSEVAWGPVAKAMSSARCCIRSRRRWSSAPKHRCKGSSTPKTP